MVLFGIFIYSRLLKSHPRKILTENRAINHIYVWKLRLTHKWESTHCNNRIKCPFKGISKKSMCTYTQKVSKKKEKGNNFQPAFLWSHVNFWRQILGLSVRHVPLRTFWTGKVFLGFFQFFLLTLVKLYFKMSLLT